MFIYRQLLSGDTFGDNRHFEKAYIPLNSRSSLKSIDSYQIDDNGIPCCPNNPDISMKYAGKSNQNNGLVRYKFECPLVSTRIAAWQQFFLVLNQYCKLVLQLPNLII